MNTTSEQGAERSVTAEIPRSTTTPDQLYLLQAGFIYSALSLVRRTTARSTASIVLTATRAPIELSIDGRTSTHQAVAVQPVIERCVHAENARVVSIQVSPHHPDYPRFRALPAPGCLSLDREAFAPFDEQLHALHDGRLSVAEASTLFDGIMATAARYLPVAKPADPRVRKALEILKENPNFPLTELAAQLAVSYYGMSRMFADAVGLSLRSYVLWVKVRTAALLLDSGASFTDIAMKAGFHSSAHLCHTWMRAFGVQPSYTLNRMQIHWWKPNKEKFDTEGPLVGGGIGVG